MFMSPFRTPTPVFSVFLFLLFALCATEESVTSLQVYPNMTVADEGALNPMSTKRYDL